MSYYKLPCVRDYWSMQNGVDAVRNVLTVNRFDEIREYLHINKNDEYDAENPDRLFKVRYPQRSFSIDFHAASFIDR